MVTLPKAKRSGVIGSFRGSALPAIAALAAGALVSDELALLTDDATVVKVALRGRFTAGAAEGPLLLGVANSDLSDAEIEAYLELDGPTSPQALGSASEIEVRGKAVKVIGVVPVPASGPMAAGVYSIDFEQSLTLSIRSGRAVKVWAYNLGANAVNGGSTLYVRANCICRWHEAV